jgi:hypothetical protein
MISWEMNRPIPVPPAFIEKKGWKRCPAASS